MTETTQEIPRDDWRRYFDELAKRLPTVEVTVEVIGSDVGDQLIGQRLRLTGITYDNKDDVLVVGLDAPGGSPEELQHFVYNPQRIEVTENADGSSVVEVEDAEDHKTIISYAPVPALPPE